MTMHKDEETLEDVQNNVLDLTPPELQKVTNTPVDSTSASQLRDNPEGVQAPPITAPQEFEDFHTPDLEIPSEPPPTQTPEGESSPIERERLTEGDDQVLDHDHPDAPLRWSGRTRKAVDRLTSAKLGDLMSESLISALSIVTSYFMDTENRVEHCYVQFKKRIERQIISHQARVMHYEEAVELNVDGSINTTHPFSFATTTANNEAYHFHQAMQEDDREEFIAAMIKELEDHTKNNHWVLVARDKIGDMPTIKAIWSFKRKRRPDGSLLKHKARLCAHGGMQVYGVNFWDTYAPVVNWISIRMMLTLSVIHKLYTTSIDFTLAFPQADADVEIYMEIPIGCEVPEG
jgi:hypothetical protein